MTSRDPPRTQFVCDVEPIGELTIGGICGDDEGKTIGPLQRTTMSAPNIDTVEPKILA